MGHYEIFNDKGGKARFNLKASNGQVILSSEGYESTSARDNGIASVQACSQDAGCFEDKSSSSGQPYFVLKAKNGQVIGQSEMYNSDSAKDNGKASVMKNGGSTDIRERKD